MFFHLIKIIKNCDTIIFKDISNAFKDIPFFSTHKKKRPEKTSPTAVDYEKKQILFLLKIPLCVVVIEVEFGKCGGAVAN